MTQIIKLKKQKIKKTKKIKVFKPHKGVDVDIKHNPKILEEFKQTVTNKGSYLCSIKHDGWRVIFKDGEMYTSTMKPCPNRHLHDAFADLKQATADSNVILDAEFDDPDLSFSEISSILGSKDREIGNIKPYFFDLIYGQKFTQGYSTRFLNLKNFILKRGYDVVEHKLCTNVEEILAYFQDSLERKLEGIMIRHIDSPYKFGRSTMKSGHLYKMKDIVTYDAKILDIKFFKNRKVHAGEPILYKGKHKMAGEIRGLWTNTKGEEIEVKIACFTMKDLQRAQVWKDREQYIGQWVEFKALLKGQKNLPRSARFYRFRNELEKSV